MMQNHFVRHLLDLLNSLGNVHAKAMFGGHGIYKEDLMFGLVADDALYLKADENNRDDFISRGLEPFEYGKKGKSYTMSYYLVPEEALEDSEEMCQWARKSISVARRAATKKNKNQL